MQINISNPSLQTNIFIILLTILAVLTARRDPSPHEMDHSHSDELKGAAILMVVFSHIGYFLFSDHRFLFPFSVWAGVGVNIFLFLSGFGLTRSEIKSNKTALQFYKKRLQNIFVPMWIALALILAADYFLLDKTYKLSVILSSFLGFFPAADIYSSINSSLWYFTPILFYYLIFPLVFRRNKPVFSIILLLAISIFLPKLNLPVSDGVLKLYRLHTLAFPLGATFAYVNEKKIGQIIKLYLQKLSPGPILHTAVRYFFVVVLLFIFGYTSIHSGVGKSSLTEQTLSIVTMSSLILIFLLKTFHSKLFIILGIYSYEIYLIHWPILYRFDFIYKNTPAFLGTLLYLALFVMIGFILKRVVRIIIKSG